MPVPADLIVINARILTPAEVQQLCTKIWTDLMK